MGCDFSYIRSKIFPHSFLHSYKGIEEGINDLEEKIKVSEMELAQINAKIEQFKRVYKTTTDKTTRSSIEEKLRLLLNERNIVSSKNSKLKSSRMMFRTIENVRDEITEDDRLNEVISVVTPAIKTFSEKTYGDGKLNRLSTLLETVEQQETNSVEHQQLLGEMHSGQDSYHRNLFQSIGEHGDRMVLINEQLRALLSEDNTDEKDVSEQLEELDLSMVFPDAPKFNRQEEREEVKESNGSGSRDNPQLPPPAPLSSVKSRKGKKEGDEIKAKKDRHQQTAQLFSIV